MKITAALRDALDAVPAAAPGNAAVHPADTSTTGPETAGAGWCNCQAAAPNHGPWHPAGDTPFCPPTTTETP